MKFKFLITFLLIGFQFVTSQNKEKDNLNEINKNEYPNKIFGKWARLNFNPELGEYNHSEELYNFKSNNTLEILKNNVVNETYSYEISLTDNYQNIFISTQIGKPLVILKLVDNEDKDFVDIYSIKILYNSAGNLVLGMEFPGRTYNHITLEKIQ